MIGWRTVRIGDLGRVVTGRTPPAALPEAFRGSVPFITPTDIDGASRFLLTTRAVSEAWDTQQSRISLPPRAICVVCIGATIGKICMTATTSQSNQQINSVIVDEARFDPFYVYYYLSTLPQHFRKLAAGAATPILNKTAFSDQTIEVPPLEEQRRIALILSAYDDLIEVNRRRIAILEEMARRLFEEWFVHLRFPGHATVPLRDTPDGLLPEGWCRAPLKRLCELQSGFAFKSSSFDFTGKHKLVTIKNVQDGRFIPNCESRLSSTPHNMPDHCVLSDGDICMSLTGNVARVCLVYGGPFLLNQRVAKLEPRDIEFYSYVYALTSDEKFRKRLVLIANGVAQQNLSPIQAGNIAVTSPPVDLLRRYDRLMRPVIESITNANNTNLILSSQRDALLPRLISGELALSSPYVPEILAAAE